MKLTKEQRLWVIDQLIDNEIENNYKYRDRYHQLYYGVIGYKDTPDEELLEMMESWEIEIPKDLPLLCVKEECKELQTADGEYCKVHYLTN